MADVIAGKTGKDVLSVLEDKTQVYGLAGDDTLKSYAKNEVLLIGGSGNDVLQMTGGTGTLVGGKGNDIFALNYSAAKKISAVIEDIDPTNDKIIVTFDDTALPQLTHKISGNDVIWTDDKGYFNLTLKSSSEASDYYDGAGNENIWDVLRLTNQERENQNLSPLTLSQNLSDGAAIRSEEIIETFSHTRPDGTSCFTAVKNIYWSLGENIAGGQTSPENVVTAWMNSPGHRANILNSSFEKLGVGYTYDASSKYQYNWVQMFGGSLDAPDTLSSAAILNTKITLQNGSLPEDTSDSFNTVISVDNTNIRRGGVYTVSKNFSGIIRINTTDAVTIDASNSGSLKNVRVVAYSDTADLTIKNLTVTNETGSALTFGDGTGNKLTLTGKNVLATSDTWAAVVNIGGGLTIDGSGSLDVTAGSQGPGIGLNSYQDGNANLTLNGVTITATTNMGAGIGSGAAGSIGNITVNGGNVKVTSKWGEEIGAGYNGTSGTVTSNDTGEDTSDTRKIVGTKNADVIKNTVQGATIQALEGNDTVSNTGTEVSIDGGSGNDSISNVGNYVTIFGGAGNDRISLGGNTQGNLIQYTSGDGNDTIYGFNSTATLSISGGKYSTAQSGKDVLVKVDAGSILLKNVSGSTFNIKGTLDGGSINSTLQTITNSDKSPVILGTTVKTVDASTRTKAIKITGNGLANSIVGGTKNDSLYGDDGNDTILGNAGNDKIFGNAGDDILTGGAGNDSLWGDAGSDKFIYSAGDGKDVIFGFDESDMLEIIGAFTGTYNKSKNQIAFKVGSTSNAITLRNFTAATFNINGDTYQISGTKFVQK